MAEDEAGKPIWKLKDSGRDVLSAPEIANKAGVSQQAMEWALNRMLEMGIIVKVYSPLCSVCGAVVDDYPTPDAVPEEVECPECGQHHHVSELDLRVGYSVVSND